LIVARLADLDHAVAAAGERAGIGALVVVDVVAVVAALARTHKPVSAARGDAAGHTRVRVVVVAVVALLDAGEHVAITTRGLDATGHTRVGVVVVAVVARLVGVDDSVAAKPWVAITVAITVTVTVTITIAIAVAVAVAVARVTRVTHVWLDAVALDTHEITNAEFPPDARRRTVIRGSPVGTCTRADGKAETQAETPRETIN
jgi:hypothetical protein